jgi:peptidyl-prolyl cis-trans isomerase SurA
VRKYFNTIPADSLPMFGATAELLEIARIPKVSKQQDSIALAKCKELRAKILNGSDFALLAKLNSQDPGSAKAGGDLGEMERGVLVPEFESVAFSLRDNEISEPVKTPFGYHIIQTIKNLGNRIKVRHILIKAEITTDDAIQCINQLDSIKKAIEKGTILFEDAVQKYSDEATSKSMNGILADQQTGQVKYELSAMDADLRKAVMAGNVGDITEALVYSQPTGENAFRIVLIKNKKDEHKANLVDDYARIQEVATQEKQQKAMEKWVLEGKAKYYIWIDNAYKSCELLQPWF